MHKDSKGYVLLVVIMLLAVASAMVAVNFLASNNEVKMMYSSTISQGGYNAAEAGLNVRAENIRSKLLVSNVPSGNSPSKDCLTGSNGSGDFACENLTLGGGHTVTTYMTEHPSNPTTLVIPTHEPFAGLFAREYRYTVNSVARNNSGKKEADLGLNFKTRLVPMFQFLYFMDDDLELTSGGYTRFDGRIHSNHDIFFTQQRYSGDMDILGPITATGDFVRGPKFQDLNCGVYGGLWTQAINIFNYSSYVPLPACNSVGHHLTDAELLPYNGNAAQHTEELRIPNAATFEAFRHGNGTAFDFTYWDSADVRFVLRLGLNGLPMTSDSTTGIVVVDRNDAVKTAATSRLNDTCFGNLKTQNIGARPVGVLGGLRVSEGGVWPATYANDGRLRLMKGYIANTAGVNVYETVLDVDVPSLLACISDYSSDFGVNINNTTDGGLVLFFAVDGPLKNAAQNNYAVRFRNASKLQASGGGHPNVKGLTMVTDQKAVIWGDYNSVDWIPSAVIGDTVYSLSNGWIDSIGSSDTRDNPSWINRLTGPVTTTIQSAIITGIRTTCDANSTTCSGGYGVSNGGPMWFFTWNEAWYNSSYTQTRFVWKGSGVSVGRPKHDQTMMYTYGPWSQYWSVPSADSTYDTRFNDISKLPPLTPSAVYLRQELLERNYTPDT